MKTIFSFLLVCATFMASAQKRLSGSENVTSQNGGRQYTAFSWTVSYRFVEENKKLMIHFFDGSINILSESNYLYGSERYSKADLGISAWPSSTQRPTGMVVKVNVLINGKNFQVTGVNNGQNGAFVAPMSDIPGINLDGIGVSLISMRYNMYGDDQVDQLIAAKKKSSVSNGQVSSANGSTNSGYSNPSSQPSSSGSSSSKAYNSVSASSSQQAAAERLRVLQQQQVAAAKQQQAEAVVNLATYTAGFIGDLVGEARANRIKKEQRLEKERQAEKEAKLKEALQKAEWERLARQEVDIFLAMAEAGNVMAMNAVGNNYHTFDKAKSNYWLEKAANLGSISALNSLRWNRYWDNNRELDSESVNYIVRAANLGDVNSLNYLAEFVFGSRISAFRDLEKAITCFKKAADLGDAQAMYKLGMLYTGEEWIYKSGKYKDYSAALKWFEAAADANTSGYTPWAIKQIALIYEGGKGSIKKDKQKAKEYHELAAKLENQLGRKFYTYAIMEVSKLEYVATPIYEVFCTADENQFFIPGELEKRVKRLYFTANYPNGSNSSRHLDEKRSELEMRRNEDLFSLIQKGNNIKYLDNLNFEYDTRK